MFMYVGSVVDPDGFGPTGSEFVSICTDPDLVKVNSGIALSCPW